MKELIEKIWHLRRDLISDGYDRALEQIKAILSLKVIEIPTGTKCWTWTVPEKWSVQEAYIENRNGERLLDLKNHPLHIVSYSLPVDKWLSREELLKHLYTKPDMPDIIPYEYKFYERDWGFCLPHNQLSKFSQEKYHAVIKSKFEKGALKVGEYKVKGETEKIITLVAHLCHPAQANDDLAGAAVLVSLAQELGRKKIRFTYQFLLVPETIGSIAYLSQNEKIIKDLYGGIFLEMLGSSTPLALQYSQKADSQLDKIAKYVFSRRFKDFKQGAFRTIVSNDEMVFNSPGVNVPMLSISRYPYKEHHTSADTLQIISEEKLKEAKEVIWEIIEMLEKNYRPERTFKGPVFLSGLGLWVDWRKDFALNKKIEQMMFKLEGGKTVLDIALELEMDFNSVLHYLDKFFVAGLIKKLPL